MVSESWKERLLEATCVQHKNEINQLKKRGNGKVGHRDKLRAKKSYTEEDIIRKLQGKAGGSASPGLRRRFLIRLAVALHSYGSSASRTEYLIDRAADRLDVEANICVFPSLILLSFPGNLGVCTPTVYLFFPSLFFPGFALL